MRLQCLLFYFFNSILFLNTLCAQDSSSAQLSTSNAIAFYNKYIGESSHLYSGSEHAPYEFRINGNPYFESNLLQNGSINYNDILFRNVLMAYDIVRDEVTTNRYNENFRMKLVSEKIAYFSLFGHFFVRLVQDSLSKSLIPTGFYDRLYNGKIKLFAKRQKIIKETVTADEGDKLWFEENDLYFFYKNEKYYSIKSKNDLLDFFRDRKKDVKRYLRKNKIKFNKDKETTILKSVEYYDQLKN